MVAVYPGRNRRAACSTGSIGLHAGRENGPALGSCRRLEAGLTTELNWFAESLWLQDLLQGAIGGLALSVGKVVINVRMLNGQGIGSAQ